MNKRGVSLLVLVVVCLIAVAAWAKPELPWRRGDSVAEGWKIAEIVRHEEFVRLKLKNQEGQLVGAEIVAARADDVWSSQSYRVQPRPDMPASRSVLTGLLSDLKRWEARPGHASFVARSQAVPAASGGAKKRARGPLLPSHARVLSLGLHLGLGLSLLVLALAWWHRVPAIRPWLMGVVAFGAVVGSAFLQLVAPGNLPVEWLTPLHEGTQSTSVEQLYARGHHALANYSSVASWFSGDDSESIRHLVRMNLFLWGVNSLLMGLLGRQIAGSALVGLAGALIYALNLNTVNAAFSELPSLLLTSYLLLAVVAGATLHLEAQRDRRVSWAALAALALLGTLASWTRIEMAAVAGPAVLVGLARLLAGEARVADLRRWVLASFSRFRRLESVRQLAIGAVVLVVLLVISVALGQLRGGKIAWVARAVDPLATSILSAPQLLSRALPLAVVVLCVLGWIGALSRPIVFLGLPLTLVPLYRLYKEASHGVPYEEYRYMTMFVPFCVLLALFGWRTFVALLERWPRWARGAQVLLVALFFVPRVAGAVPLWNEDPPMPSLDEPLLSRDRQIEVRYLLSQVEAHPRCVFVSRMLKGQPAAARGKRRYQWVVFGELMDHPMRIDADEQPSSELIAELSGQAECVMLYRGLDCNRVGVDCGSDVVGLRRVDELRFRSLSYSWPAEWGPVQHDVVLDVYRSRGDAEGPGGQP